MARSFSFKTLVLAGALALGGLSASAAPVMFDFRQMSGTPAASLTQTKSGLTVTVQSVILQSGNFVLGGLVTQAAKGLGVKGRAADTDDAIDSSQPREALLFSFSKVVQFRNLLVTEGNLGDRLLGAVDQVPVGGLDLINGNNPINVINQNYFGNSLAIIAVQPTGGGISSFRIGTLTVAAIPLPAGGLLLASAALLLPLLRRKRRA